VGRYWTIHEDGILYADGVYTDGGSTPATLELFDPSTRAVSRVAVLGVRPCNRGISVSPDGRWVFYTRGRGGPPESDIILVGCASGAKTAHDRIQTHTAAGLQASSPLLPLKVDRF
jgi:hypothetical protein